MENIAPTKFGPVDRSGRLQNRLYLLRAAVVDRRAMASLGIAAFCSTAADGSRTFVVLTAECTDLATLRPRLPPAIKAEWLENLQYRDSVPACHDPSEETIHCVIADDA